MSLSNIKCKSLTLANKFNAFFAIICFVIGGIVFSIIFVGSNISNTVASGSTLIPNHLYISVISVFGEMIRSSIFSVLQDVPFYGFIPEGTKVTGVQGISVVFPWSPA